MTKKKSVATKVKVRVTGTCTLFATFAMACPLCKVTIPANTTHSCEKRETE